MESSGFNKELRPRGAVGVYILNDNAELLLFLRTGKHGTGTWCPPGGHIEFGESFKDAVRRETKEECCINVKDIEVAGVTNDIHYDEQKQYVTVHVRVVSYKGEPRLVEQDKFGDMKWFKLNNLPDNLFLANKNFFALNPDCLCGSGKKYKKCHGE